MGKKREVSHVALCMMWLETIIHYFEKLILNYTVRECTVLHQAFPHNKSLKAPCSPSYPLDLLSCHPLPRVIGANNYCYFIVYDPVSFHIYTHICMYYCI